MMVQACVDSGGEGSALTGREGAAKGLATDAGAVFGEGLGLHGVEGAFAVARVAIIVANSSSKQ